MSNWTYSGHWILAIKSRFCKCTSFCHCEKTPHTFHLILTELWPVPRWRLAYVKKTATWYCTTKSTCWDCKPWVGFCLFYLYSGLPKSVVQIPKWNNLWSCTLHMWSCWLCPSSSQLYPPHILTVLLSLMYVPLHSLWPRPCVFVYYVSVCACVCVCALTVCVWVCLALILVFPLTSHT